MTDLFQPKQVLVPGLLSSEAINEQLKQFGDATRGQVKAAPPPDAALGFADQIIEKSQADAARNVAAPPKPAAAQPSFASRLVGVSLFSPVAPAVGLLEQRLLSQFGTLSPEESHAEAVQREAAAKSREQAIRSHAEVRNKLRGLTDAELQNMGMPVDPAGGVSLRPLQGGEHLSAPDGSAEMTEYTKTVEDGNGQFMVAPSLWTDGSKPQFIETDDEVARRALDYEAKTGNRFPRFATVDDAEKFAIQRSAAGGVGTGQPLARRSLEPAEVAATEALVHAGRQVRGEEPAPTQTWWLNAIQTAARSEAETVTGALRYGPEIWEGVKAAISGSPAEKSAAREWLDTVDKGLEQILPGDKARSKDFMTKLSGGAGSFAGFLTAGYVGEALGLPTMLTVGGLGAMTEGDSLFREAEGFGATDLQKYMALLIGSGLGVTEAIPIDRMLRAADAASGGGVRRLLRTTVTGALGEFIQEVSQEVGEDVTAKYAAGYDPTRELSASKYATGGTVAALLGGFGGFVTAETHTPTEGRTTESEPPAPETVAAPAAIHPDVHAEQATLNDILGDAAPAEGLVAPVEEGRSNVSFEAAPGEGSPAAELLGERFSGLPASEQAAISRDMTTAAYGEMAQIAETVGDTKFVQGIGGWLGGQAPSAVASFEDVQDAGKVAANMLGYLLQQTEVWASSVRPFDSGPADSVAIDLIDSGGDLGNDGLAGLFRQVSSGGPKTAEGEPLIQGFQPITTPDGRDGIRILAGDSPADVAALRQYAEAVLPEKLDDAITIRSGAASIYKARNDWSKDREGNGYLSALQGLGRNPGPQLADARQRLQDQFGQSLDAAEGRGVEAQTRRDPLQERADRIEKVAEAIDPPLPGLPVGSSGVGWVQSAARAYAEEAGTTFRRQSVYTGVDPTRGKRIADAYAAMEHRPYDADVKEAYGALIDETLHQYQFVKASGLKVEAIAEGQADPYPGGSKDVIADLRANHLWFFPTEQGFGTEAVRNDNPLLMPTGEFLGDRELVANDVFRIVHDVFGHGLEGAAFGARGEENAWQAHSRLYSPLAARAMTTETRGQNSWVNFGPHGEANRANPKETVYADQKTGLLPEWVSTEGLVPDQPYGDPDIEAMRAYHGSRVAGITAFKPSERGAFGPGIYFGRESLARAYAGEEGTVYPADIEGRLFSFMPEWVYGFNKEAINGRIQNVLGHLPDGAAKDAFNAWWKDGTGHNVSDVYDRLTRGAFSREQVSKAIADAGYSGIEGIADGYEIVVFDPADAPIASDIEAMTANEFYQSRLNTLDEMYAAAQPDQDMLDAAARTIAEEVGAEYVTPGLKNRATAEAKIGRKGYVGAGQITDIVRGGFLLRSTQEADAIVQLLAERFPIMDEGWKRTPVGYTDRKLMIRFDNGLLGEVQLLERAMFEAKEPAGHKLYEQWRALPPGDSRAEGLVAKMKALYAEAAAVRPDFWSSVDTSSEPKFLNLARQAFSDNTDPSVATSAASTSDQSAEGVSLANARNPAVNTAGRLSQLIKSTGDTSSADMGIEGATSQGRLAPFKAEPSRPGKGVAEQGQSPPDAGLSLIGKNLIALMNLTVRQGRLTLKGDQVMGQYSRKQAVIRLRNSNDLSSLAHEAGHALHDSMAGALSVFSRANDRDLTKVAHDLYAGGGQAAKAALKPGTENREGFAEFFRLFVTNPTYARTHYPSLTASFEQTLQQNAPDLLRGLQAVTRQYNAWLNTSSVNALRTMVTRPRKLFGLNASLAALKDKGFRTWMEEVGRKFVTEAVDRTRGLRYLTTELLTTAERNLGAPLDLKHADNPTTLARLAKNVGSRAMVELTDGVMGYRSTKSSTRGLRDALLISQGLGANGNPRFLDETKLQDFDTYLVALRALDEYRRFRAGIIDRPPIDASLGDVRQSIKDLEAIHGESFRQAAEIVHEYGMGLWRKAYDAGLMDDETFRDGLERQFYAPLQRDMTDRTANLGLGPTALNAGAKFVKRFKGSDRDIISPMTALMHKTFALEKIIAENDVKKALGVLADKAGQAGSLVERVPAHRLLGRNVSFAEAAKAITQDASISPTDAQDLMTILQSAIEDEKAFAVFRPEQASTRGENIVFYWEKGKLQAIQIMDGEVGADVVNMLNGLGRENLPLGTELIALSSTAFRTAITSWPDFLLVNYIRDQVSSWILNDVGFKPVISGAKGIWAEVRRKQAAIQYNASAGIMGGMNVAALHSARVEQDIGALRRKGYVASAFNEPGIKGAVKGFGKLVELSETGTRIGLFEAAFKRAKSDGLSDWEASVEAGYIATDTMDFGLNGTRMTFLRRVIPFLNAQIQGLYKMMRTLGGGEAAQRKGLTFALSAYFKNVNNLPLSRVERNALNTGRKAWIKMASLGLLSAALYYLFKDDPDYQDASEYLRVTGWVIPMGDGRIFYVPKPFELAVVANIVERGLEAAGGDAAAPGRFFRGAAMTMTPPTAPPAILSLVEYAFNKSMFTGQPIVPDYMQALEPQLQYNARTSELAKTVGRTMNWSPLVVDHFLSSLGASAYRDASWLSNAVDPNRPSSDPTDMPILRRFVRDARRGATSARDFWQIASTVNGTMRTAEVTYKTLLDSGNEPAANRYLAGLPADQRAYAVLMTGFDADAKRINPFYRGRQITTVVSAMRRELVSPLGVDSTLTKFDDPIMLSASQKHDVDQLLSEYGRRETRNTLIATGVAGWAGKRLLPTDPTLDMISKISPELRDELDRRLAKSKVYNGSSVFEYWPEARDRLIQDGADAILTDLVAIERIP